MPRLRTGASLVVAVAFAIPQATLGEPALARAAGHAATSASPSPTGSVGPDATPTSSAEASPGPEDATGAPSRTPSAPVDAAASPTAPISPNAGPPAAMQPTASPDPTLPTVPTDAGATSSSAAPFDAAPALRLDAYGAVSYALAHAPTLLAQAATIAQNDLTFTRDRAAEYPALTGQLQSQLQRTSNASGSLAQFGLTPSSRFSQNTAQVFSSYNLYNGTQPIVAKQADRITEAARYELVRLAEQLAISVSGNFFAIAGYREMVAIDLGDLAYQKALLATAVASEKVGRVAGVDVLRAKVGVTRSRSALIQARVDERNARESLAVQIGAPADYDFAVPSVIPEPPRPTVPTDVLITMAKLHRPEVLEAKATLASARLGDAQVDSDLRPTVALTGAFGSQVSPTSFTTQQAAIDAQNAANLASYQAQKQLFPNATIAPPVPIPAVDRHQPGFWQFGATSTFQIPLYDYGVRAAGHHAARAQIESAIASLDNAYAFVRSDVDASDRNLESAYEKLQLAKESVDLARESARIAQLQYKDGLISFTDATQTEQTALGAENDLLAAHVNYISAFIRLRVALAPTDTAAAADLRGL